MTLIFEEIAVAFNRINFAMQRLFGKWNLNVYNLDVFNLFNFYDNKNAKMYKYCQSKIKYKWILKAMKAAEVMKQKQFFFAQKCTFLQICRNKPALNW